MKRRIHLATVSTPIEVEFVYVIYMGGCRWLVIDGDNPLVGGGQRFVYNFNELIGGMEGKIPIPMDALFAIGAGYIKPTDLQYPETLVAMISLCNA